MQHFLMPNFNPHDKEAELHGRDDCATDRPKYHSLTCYCGECQIRYMAGWRAYERRQKPEER